MKNAIPGGSFVLGAPASIFRREDFSAEQRLIAQTAAEFAREEVLPAADAMERQDFAVTRRLLRRAGELGLTAVDIPEAYGGMGLDFTSSAIVADCIAVYGAFSVAFGAHTGIGTLPLVYFGTEEQKRKYLPKLASAEWIGAYALSEAGSGSDALALRAQAVLDGPNYILNGEKMWISNAGFADLFTVFAKVDGEVTAFLVERTFPGVSIGSEEHKMGIKGSSTCPLVLRDAVVPKENALGAIGKGHLIAFQILNVGRFKLGAACVGGARDLLAPTLAYAKQRQAFGKPIASFGLMKQAIADMVIGIYATESALYRTVGLFGSEHADLESLDEYAIECSIVKVEASEMLSRAADTAVQIFGGYGFVQEYPAERAYRDARVNRIFEGTNEINRLLISGMTLRRSARGKLPLAAAVKAAMGEMLEPAVSTGPVDAARKMTLLLAGAAFQRYGERLSDQQEILAAISDAMIAVYTMQSVTLRQPDSAVAEVVVAEGLDRVEAVAQRALASVAEGDTLRAYLAFARRLMRREPVDVYALRREVAQTALDLGHYPYA